MNVPTRSRALARHFLYVAVLTISLMGGARAFAVTVSWTGSGSTGNWSEAANWGGTVPVSGDLLAFPSGVTRTAMTNDLPAANVYDKLVFNGSGYVLSGNTITVAGGISIPYQGGATLNAPIRLAGPQTIAVQWSAAINSPIDLNGFDVSLQGYGTTYSGVISGTGNVRLESNVIQLTANNTYVGTTTVATYAGIFGQQPQSDVIVQGPLSSNGSLGNVTVSGMGSLSPGSSVACCSSNNGTGLLRTKNLAFGANTSLQRVEINGPIPGTDYDQIKVTGTVTIGASVSMNVLLSTAFVPSVGQVFTLIDNDGTDPIAGTFSGLPEGATMTFNGAYPFRISYVGGDGNDVTLTSLSGLAPSGITLASSANPAAVGQPVTFTATVTAASGTPTGTVVFLDGSTQIGSATLASGKATFTSSSLGAGAHSIIAKYLGDTVFGSSFSATLVQNVNALATTTTLSATPNPSAMGGAVTFSATVSASAGTPSGLVAFQEGANMLGTVALSAGVARLTTSTLPIGTHSIVAAYAGDTSYQASASVPWVQSVAPAVTVPGAPGVGSAIAGDGEGWVSFTPPASDGGSAITSYTVTSSPGGISASGTGSPLHVIGLSNGATYTFSVIAGNAVGASSPSAFSNAVTPTARATPPGTAFSGVQQVVAGIKHTCVLTASGGVKCWGDNTFGQLGNGTNASSPTPVDVVGLSSRVVAIGSSAVHTCAVDTVGALKCWGDNETGQLGVGDNVSRNVATQVLGLATGVALVSPGQGHTCVVMANGSVKCWGNYQNGRIGNGATTYQYAPVDVSLGGPAASVAAGGAHTCAVSGGGAVKCWGINVDGQIGNGTTADQFFPTNVLNLASGAVGVSTGWGHTCARKVDDTLLCWGAYQKGQLGYPTTSDSFVPRAVAGDFGHGVDPSMNWYHTCILARDGGVRCWGLNDAMQLGDGTNTNRQTPVDVLGLGRDNVEVAAGYQHTCVRTAGGSVECWGANDAGQLGDGTTISRGLPLPVTATSDQTISVGAMPSSAAFGTSFNVSASASSGLAVTVAASGACTLSGSTVTMTSGSGTCTVTATQPGNGSYNAAPAVMRAIAATRAGQSVTLTGAPASAVFGTSFAVNAASSAGLAVAITAGGSCSANGATITMTSGGGICTLTAAQPGNDNYTPAQANVVVNALRAPQRLTLRAPAAVTYGDAPFAIAASSDANLPVSLASLTPAVCSLAGSTVTVRGAGTCTIRASQPGDVNHTPAADVDASIAVAPRAITVVADARSKFAGNADPLLTYALQGSLVAGDSFSGALTRSAGETVGVYTIAQGSLQLGPSYALTFVPSALRIVDVTLVGPADAIGVGLPATITASYPASGTSASACTVAWGDGGAASVVTASMTAGNWVCTASHAYTAANLYAPTVTVSDPQTGTAVRILRYVPIYDAAAGKLTGGGWIDSPSGAFSAGSGADRGTVSVTAQYGKNDMAPKGNASFHLRDGAFGLSATSFDWLIVSGDRAHLKGRATVNGAGDYAFVLIAAEGNRGSGSGRLRIKAWERATGRVVYDNAPGPEDLGSPLTVLGGGNITVH